MEQNNKRIFRNTVYLYIRQFVIMALSFFTTRIVLEKLGASDYGVNNVVGGFVSLFTILNSILQTGTRRFLALNLGKGNAKLMKRTFSTAFIIHLIAGIFIVILLETIGIWFLNTKLNIDPTRMIAANWVFQFSVLSVFLNITQTPYTAAVTAHEQFNIYAIMSISDVIAKVMILFLLVFIPGDKLIIYSALLLVLCVTNVIIYHIYCLRHFQECSFSFKIDNALFKEMIHFSGWSTISSILQITNSQGLSILLNIFFNTIVNAARGLAATVTTTINIFVNGFIIAAEPQLIKYYGSNDRKHFEQLIFNITQYTLFLISIIAVPIFLEIDYVLKLWLKEVPQYTSEFIKITMISSIIVNSYTMIDRGIMASGHIKQLALIANTTPIIVLPLVYLVLKLGFNPIMTYIVNVIPQFLGLFTTLWIIRKYVGFPSFAFLKRVILKTYFLIGLSCIIPYWIHCNMKDGAIRFLAVCSLSVICTITIMYIFALNKETRILVQQKIVGRFRKVKYLPRNE